jgi:hypothetical protein
MTLSTVTVVTVVVAGVVIVQHYRGVGWRQRARAR